MLLWGALLLMVGLACLGSPARAQPEVAWERVGDVPHDAFSLPHSLGHDGYLWNAFNEFRLIDGERTFFQGVYRLPAPYDSTSVWENVSLSPGGISEGAYIIGRDTILFDGGNQNYRSTTGGSTWERIAYLSNLMRVFEVPGNLPHAGRLIAVRGPSMASFSDDRGATWTAAPQTSPPGSTSTIAGSAEATRIALVTSGPHAGRIVGAGLSGITTSDDGGYTWQATSEFAFYQQDASCIATLHGQAPAGGDRLVTVMNDIRIPDDSIRVILSDDGGETWQRGQGLFPGAFRTCIEVVDLGDGRAVVVMMRGPLWWTEDAGETWIRWAEWDELVPPTEIISNSDRARWAIVGPDGHLIVGITSNSPNNSIYDKRSSEPVASWAIAEEPEVLARATLRVSPNPSHQLVTVALVGADRQPVEILIVDAQGREVARRELAAGSRWRLDVSAWAPGVYHARGVRDRQPVEAVSFTVMR
ncbi:MAG: hypothetical protein Rubg2KO_01850 [Rubricoccaceae bacterium]